MILSGGSLIYQDKATLSELCDKVLTCESSYEDVAEQIEDKALFGCEHGETESAVDQLEKLAVFFENFLEKNEEISCDLAQIYSLIGQMYQYGQRFEESIQWFRKSIVVDDQNPVTYHSLAVSYQNMRDVQNAVRCLEQEINVAPGNYYTYLLLADLYEKIHQQSDLESVLKRLLDRDTNNIQGLHRLIRFYEKNAPHADVELLRRKLLLRTMNLNRIEAVIRAYHLCRTGQFREALEFLDNWTRMAPDVTIIHLANAHIYGKLHQYSRKRYELSLFKHKNHGRADVISIKLDEFASVFGHPAAHKLRRRLTISHPVHI
ncbi:MAG: tetratricopeptide repeat protein [Chitinispirillaceae bacterium]